MLTKRPRLRDLPTYTFDPVSATVLFQFAFLISAGMGIVRQVLFSAQFGTGLEASAYIAASRLPDSLLNLVGGGALSGAMIPVLLRAAHEAGHEAEQRLINLTLTTLGLITIAAAALTALFAGPFVRGVLAPGFDAATSALTITLARLMLIEPPFLIITTVAIALLSSRNQFFLYAFSLAVHNLALISGILVARFIPGVGIYGPLAGLILDGVFQTAILLPGLRANGFTFRPVWDFGDRRLREMYSLLIPSGLSAIVNYSGTIVDTSAASFTRESGTLPAVNYALLLIGVPTRLLGIAIGQAVFPRVAAHIAEGERRPARKLIRRSLLISLGLSLPAAAAMLVGGRLLVSLLFERGAFSAAAGDLTFGLLAVYALGLPSYTGTEILTRGLTALYDTRTPLFTNTVQVVGRIAIIMALLGSLGAIAIPIAFVITSAVETLILGVVLWARLR